MKGALIRSNPFPNPLEYRADFDTVFYPGGHGPMWDLAEDKR
jgi:putative intracellular protease/amidase